MPDLADGEAVEMKGSGAKPYVLKNVGGVYSCTCPAWRNQSVAIERRSCKHLRKLRGDAAEELRIGQDLPPRPDAEAGEEGSAGVPLLLAQPWDNCLDLTGWWMSEKLDGVRAYWNGKCLISRLGNPFHVPDWFLAGMPDVPLDGELWLARKSFQRTVGIVRRQDKSDLWKEVTYVVFDAPGALGTFEERVSFVRDHVAAHQPPHVVPHAHAVCESLAHLRDELARVESLGGEGLMLRQPQSMYEIGRSMTLLKVKNFRDAEATVLEHLKGSGRHKGRLGALLVELPDGTQFSVGTGFSDAERESPPPPGAIITFRYQELSDAGVPRFPSYVGVRDAAPKSRVQAPTSAAPSPRQKASATGTTAITSADSTVRRFELVEGSARKFWEVSRSGRMVIVRFGRIGTAGQSQSKDFPDDGAAERHAAKLISEKVAKGYHETGAPGRPAAE
jgi:DNA ligase-1